MNYNKKVTTWNHKQEIQLYRNPIEISNSNKTTEPKSRTKYENMDSTHKKLSDTRRTSYYKKKIQYLIDLALHNHLDTFVTLTFKDDITDYSKAQKEWDLFLKRLKYKYKNIRYIAVHELQKRGVYHFHFVCDLNYIPNEILEKIWGNGFTYIRKIKITDNFGCAYLFKYILKDILKDTEKGKRSKARPVYCSRNLEKPHIEKKYSTHPIEDDIFDNMECVIEDGHYDVKNWCGVKINEVDYIKIKK